MTASIPIGHSPRFVALEQADFQRLEHAGYLKGLLQPFKGKGSLETWASQCAALRDDLIGLAQRRVLPQARAYPFSLLDVQLAQQATGAGTTFLRWRNLDRSSMGVALWEALLANPATPGSLIDELYAIELQRIVLNKRWLRLFGQYFEILSGTLRAHHAAVLIAGSIAKYASSGV